MNLEKVWKDAVKPGEVRLVVVVVLTSGGVDRLTSLLMLIIFCLPLVIQRPGVLGVMKTLNHQVYV